jgi:hypothetical protein
MPDGGFVKAPVFEVSERLFTDSLQIRIAGNNIRYSTDGDSIRLPLEYSKPFSISSTTRIHARAYQDGNQSGLTSAAFYYVPSKWEVVLHSTPNRQYMAEGPASAIDGIRGSTNWRKGDWHGYQGQDMDVEIRFDSERELRNVEVGFLQDVRPWIVYPTEMQVQVSSDGQTWNDVGKATHAIQDTSMEAQQMTLNVSFAPLKVKFVRVKARNYGKLPAWHPGAGFDAFIFCDEIMFNTLNDKTK